MCDEGGRVGSIDRSSGPEKMKPTEAAFAMAKFSFDGAASPLVIEELLLLFGHQIWIILGLLSRGPLNRIP